MSKTSIQLPRKLELKYAQLWHDANDHRAIPAILKASWLKPINNRDKDVFLTAVYKCMDMLAEDGVIKQETIREIHNKENGWKDRSTITVGKVPSYVWLSLGFSIGCLLSGGMQLIIWIVRSLF